MTKLEQLIEQLCSDGVEYKELGEIAEYSKKRIPISEITVDEYIGVENLLQNKAGKTTASSLPTNTDVVIAFERDDVLIGNIRPYLRKIWIADCNGGTNGDVLPVHIKDKSVIIPRFLYYVLSSEKFFFYDIQNSKGAKMPRGDKAAVMRYICPVPPLEVQDEIVRILDTFTDLTTDLTTELTTELSNRKKQYEYYRNNLLTFNTNVEMKKLKDVSESIASGKNKNRSESGNYPVYGSTGIIAKTNVPVFSKEQILVARVGANAGFVHIADGEYDVSDNTLIIDVKKGYSLKYIYHYLINKNLNQFAKGGGQPLITAGQLKEIQLPVPSVEIQERIVSVLDNFESICSDLNIGLPAEIEARKKQYEYYRDLLLTFAETGGKLPEKRREEKRREEKRAEIAILQYVFGFVTVTLDDIATFTYGYTDTAKDNGSARFIRITDIDDNGYLKPNDAKYIDINSENEKYLVKHGDLLMARTGATYGKTLFVTDDDPAIYASFLIRINLDQGIMLNRYYWHFSKSSYYWNQAEKLVTTGGQPQFNANALKQITVAIPSIGKQKEIIDILDRFDAISNDIHNGLPAEIEARQKQYEYYRDKLLTFKRSNSTAS